MGQYYTGVIADSEFNVIKKVSTWEYGMGAKIMEHSWLLNDYVALYVNYLHKNPHRLIWAGDYADEREHPFHEDIYSVGEEEFECKAPVYNPRIKYLLNYSKKEFVNLGVLPRDSSGWRLHPLPLLTSNSGCFGGGDFRGENSYYGYWCGDMISTHTERPLKSDGWQEIKPNFIEE